MAHRKPKATNSVETSVSKPPIATLFLSYARGDDEAFAKRLYADLTDAGFAVWWDRESLHSVSLTFHQQIKDAIHRQIDRMIYIAGPKAAVSDYVREEWKFALECDKPVIPILRLGDYTIVPGELSLLHCDDFRDDGQYPAQLAKLIANLKRPEPPLGKLHAVPSLPRHFLGRPDLLRKLKDAVLVDLQKPVVISGAEARVGVQGMGGIGKSVVAAALARDREVRRSYPDGVLWVSLGQKPEKEEVDKWLAGFQRDVARMLGSQEIIESEAQGRVVLQKLLTDKAVFLVLDDVWEARHATAFDVLGPRCRALITTRDAGILQALEGVLHQVELFSESEALQLLADAVELTPSELPPEASAIVKECGCLPLALALCGGMARGIRWSSILERLRRADLDKIADRNAIHEQHRSIYRAMLASVEVLEPDQQRRFAELAVFPTDQTIPEAAVATLWQHTNGLDELDTEALLVNFGQRSLIRLDKATAPSGSTDERRVSMHDLLHDLATKLTGEPIRLHGILLDSYRKKCPNGWPSGPNDGYFFRNLCHHLSVATGNWDEATELLCDLRFVEARCRVGEVFEMQADYRLALDNLPEAQQGLNELRHQNERIARWIAEVTHYSQAWSLRRDRIARHGPLDETEPVRPDPPAACRVRTDEEVETECRRIRENTARLDRLTAFARFVRSECYPLINFGYHRAFVLQHAFSSASGGPVHDAAARLVSQCGVPLLIRRWPESATWNPRSAMLRTLEGHRDRVWRVKITPDGRFAVSASDDRTLRVWELDDGLCLRTLSNDHVPVWSVSITPDGLRGVSAIGRAVRVWDLERGECVQMLAGHSDNVLSVSVTPDGRWVVSGSVDETVRVWDLRSGQCVHILEGHRSRVGCVSVTSDGRRAVSGSDDGMLLVWNLEVGKCLRTLKGHHEEVTTVAVTPDGCRAVSGSEDQTLRVWSLEGMRCLRVLEGHGDTVCCVSLTPDGRRAVSASKDETLRVWDLDGKACLRVLEGHGDAVLGVSLTPDGRRAVSSGQDGTIRVWDLENGICSRTVERIEVKQTTHQSCRTPDQRLEVSRHGTTVRVTDVQSGRCVRTLKGHRYDVSSASVTPDGHRVVSTSGDDTIRVWDLESGACLHILAEKINWAESVSVTPDGRCAVAADHEQVLHLWDLESGECTQTLTGHPSDAIVQVVVFPDGRHVLSEGWDRALRIWDLKNGTCVAMFAATVPIWSLRIDPPVLAINTSSEQILLEIRNLQLGPPVIADSSDAAYEASLRRGLKQARRNQSPDHDETLAHLAALATHLERMGKADEARSFREEHDRLAPGKTVE